MSKTGKVKPGPGQDIRTYSDEQVIDRTVKAATGATAGCVSQMAGELARRALLGKRRR